ncbi:MAG: hypothetical protein JXB45_01920, partial [Candidatus Krumholzibacteriota bacterium]|nr:hypothetical protein [Candidatus Krumholzibacteriota bacterium]
MRKNRTIYIFKNSWMILAVVLLVAIFLAINWYYYRRTRFSLDRELSIRLQSLASLVSSTIAPWEDELAAGGIFPEEIPDSVSTFLRDMSREYSLSNITLVREDGQILLSLYPELLSPGDIYPLWRMDHRAIIKALQGAPAATMLYRSPGGDYLKAG